MEFEGKHEGSPSNSASILSKVKRFEGKYEGAPSKFPANTTYMSYVFLKSHIYFPAGGDKLQTRYILRSARNLLDYAVIHKVLNDKIRY